VISNPEVNHTLATLHKIEFVFWVIVKKLIYKSSLLSLYIIVHEIFTSYSFSFNSFKVIRPFSSVEKLFTSSTLSQNITRTNLVTFHVPIEHFSFFSFFLIIKRKNSSFYQAYVDLITIL